MGDGKGSGGSKVSSKPNLPPVDGASAPESSAENGPSVPAADDSESRSSESTTSARPGPASAVLLKRVSVRPSPIADARMHPEPVAPLAGQKGSFVLLVASHTAEMPGWPC